MTQSWLVWKAGPSRGALVLNQTSCHNQLQEYLVCTINKSKLTFRGLLFATHSGEKNGEVSLAAQQPDREHRVFQVPTNLQKGQALRSEIRCVSVCCDSYFVSHLVVGVQMFCLFYLACAPHNTASALAVSETQPSAVWSLLATLKDKLARRNETRHTNNPHNSESVQNESLQRQYSLSPETSFSLSQTLDTALPVSSRLIIL